MLVAIEDVTKVTQHVLFTQLVVSHVHLVVCIKHRQIQCDITGGVLYIRVWDPYMVVCGPITM